MKKWEISQELGAGDTTIIMRVKVHITLAHVDAACFHLVIHLLEESIKLGINISQKPSGGLCNNFRTVLKFTSRKLLEFLICENVEDGMAELFVANITLFGKGVDQIREFFVGQRKFEEFKASAESVDCDAPAAQFVKVFEDIPWMNVIEIYMGSKPVEEIATLRHECC
jgi:hypothetical protein